MLRQEELAAYCIGFVIRLEGGYVDNPADRGGPTKYGVTQATLGHHRGNVASASDVKNLTEMEAISIYRGAFWTPLGFHRVPSKNVALVLFAHTIHTGPTSAFKALQKSINRAFNTNLFVDGIFGPNTEIQLASAIKKNDALLCRKLLQNAQEFYSQLCENNESQLVFLRGWLRRSHLIWDEISQ